VGGGPLRHQHHQHSPKGTRACVATMCMRLA
jgi:hypothetical protein